MRTEKKLVQINDKIFSNTVEDLIEIIRKEYQKEILKMLRETISPHSKDEFLSDFWIGHNLAINDVIKKIEEN